MLDLSKRYGIKTRKIEGSKGRDYTLKSMENQEKSTRRRVDLEPETANPKFFFARSRSTGRSTDWNRDCSRFPPVDRAVDRKSGMLSFYPIIYKTLTPKNLSFLHLPPPPTPLILSSLNPTPSQTLFPLSNSSKSSTKIWENCLRLQI